MNSGSARTSSTNEGRTDGNGRSTLDRLLSRFDALSISRPVATTAATIIVTLRRAGRPLDDLHDVYIAVTARTRDLPVLTANVDHVDRIDNLHVVDWETF